MANIWRRQPTDRLDRNIIKKSNSDVGYLVADDFFEAPAAGGDVTGTAAVTLANATSTASGVETFTCTSAQTLAAFTSTASGAESFTGTSTQTLADFASTASGVELITGSSANTMDNFTSIASGTSGSSTTHSRLIGRDTLILVNNMYISIDTGRYFIKNGDVFISDDNRLMTKLNDNYFVEDGSTYLGVA